MSDIRTAVAALAAYLTDSRRVVRHSMGLESPTQKPEADAFFALRQAFGVEGYATTDEAVASIEKVLA